MDRGELHTLRVLVPGIMIALLALTLVEPSISIIQTLKDLDFGDLSGIGVAVVVGGALYTVFDARYRLTGFSWKSILDNIASRLLEILRNTRDVSEGQEKFLRDRRRLVDVFYRLLDNDESLKSRQEGIRLNGLLVTSALDLSVISCAGWWLHFGLALWRSSFSSVIASAICCGLWLLSQSVLLPLAMNRHRKLSNEQLDFIDTHYRAELGNYVNESLSHMC